MPDHKAPFHLVMIKPSHYDDDGYPIQWLRSAIPSNTLACLNGLAEDCRDREVLGEGTAIRISTFDETNRRVRPRQIMREIEADGGAALIALVGVQSNQFPRALDIARAFRQADYQVCIGGFHVSGCIAMLPELPPDLVEAQGLGISLFAGEADDGRLDVVLQDAHAGRLKPLYDHMSDLPDLGGQPLPLLPAKHVKRTAGAMSSVDLGRGCPYQCSFCTIINVQGRKSRFRTPDDLERIIRANWEQGITRFFITDDNFARNRNWEGFLDRLIWLREEQGFDVGLTIQVDTLCHRIENFITKCARAGVKRVFIGLENINPDNLMAAKKRQNKITEYRAMLQSWKRVGIITYAGYILGFPADTKQSILNDIEIIKRELPIDILEFFILTPLPGSEDHKEQHAQGVWMDPDMNKYDLNHRVTRHENMSDREFDEAYIEAWRAFYTPEHIETVMRRAAVCGLSVGKVMFMMLWFCSSVERDGVHPLESGYFRLKFRHDRRSNLPRENFFKFHAKYAWKILSDHIWMARWLTRMHFARNRIKADPNRHAYIDVSLTPPSEKEFGELGLFNLTTGGHSAVAKKQRDDAMRERHKNHGSADRNIAAS